MRICRFPPQDDRRPNRLHSSKLRAIHEPLETKYRATRRSTHHHDRYQGSTFRAAEIPLLRLFVEWRGGPSGDSTRWATWRFDPAISGRSCEPPAPNENTRPGPTRTRHFSPHFSGGKPPFYTPKCFKWDGTRALVMSVMQLRSMAFAMANPRTMDEPSYLNGGPLPHVSISVTERVPVQGIRSTNHNRLRRAQFSARHRRPVRKDPSRSASRQRSAWRSDPLTTKLAQPHPRRLKSGRVSFRPLKVCAKAVRHALMAETKRRASRRSTEHGHRGPTGPERSRSRRRARQPGPRARPRTCFFESAMPLSYVVRCESSRCPTDPDEPMPLKRTGEIAAFAVRPRS